MRTVSIRQFQRNFYNELKNVPFVVMRQVWMGEKGSKVSQDVPEFIVCSYNKELLDQIPGPAVEPPPMVTEPERKPKFEKLWGIFGK